jgi:hypothetical protein
LYIQPTEDAHAGERFPALMAAAPTQKEPPFVVTQLLVVALFV